MADIGAEVVEERLLALMEAPAAEIREFACAR
jgi:hypothetical protein